MSRIKPFRLRWNLWLPILVGIIYWIVNRRFGGPAYQQDEIGYLVNAAFFAGYVVDGYSSYHAGYSIFLAPLFTFLNEPDDIWKGVQVVNALFWAGSFYLLDKVIKNALPSAALRRRVLAVVVSAMYPAWVVMSGYAFSQSAFVFFYTASALALFGWRPERPSSILLHAALVGFLFWIHPTALGVIAASTVVIALGSWMSGRYQSLLLHFVLVFGLVIGYKAGLQAWMMKAMTPEGYEARAHYPSLAVILSSAADARFWRDWFLVIFGQFAYLSIASLGFFVAGVLQLIKVVPFQAFREPQKTSSRDIGGAMVSVFLLLSMLGVIAITATSFASQTQGPGSLDEWFYGRYAEGILLPLMAIGLAGWQRHRFTTGIAIGVVIFIVGLFIQKFSAEGAYLNLVNIQGFWPQSLLPGLSVASWFAVGAILVFIYIIFNGVVLILPLVALFMLTTQVHFRWHESILLSYSRPSAMIDFVRKNFPKGVCVGFDPYLPPDASLQMVERVRLYSFYLFDYGFRRLDISEWNQSCHGPLFSYNPLVAKLDSANLVAKEPETRLMLFANSQEPMAGSAVAIKGRRTSVVWANTQNSTCLIAGCYYRTAVDLSLYSPVGKLEDDLLATDHRLGFLFYGPYATFEKGIYRVRLFGNFNNVDGAVIDVVSDRGNSSHFRANVSELAIPAKEFIEFSFVLESNVDDLEVRLHVGKDTNINIGYYQIVSAEN